MTSAQDRIVILAAGRGTRMQRTADKVALSDAALDHAQRTAADAGLKPLIPIAGRPFIEHVLDRIKAAGFREVCVVVGPGTDAVRDYLLRTASAHRLQLRFAVQDRPRGSAHALLAARQCMMSRDDADPFVVINADNLYPVAALRVLRTLRGPGMTHAMIGFTRDGLLRGNITADRIAGYALAATDDEGWLTDIIEKPTSQQIDARIDRALISMTCWRFAPSIFAACETIEPSPRGELELPDAVRHAMATGERVLVTPSDEPVLDLSRREDIPAVERLLA
jgi:dTDP-glucose pyrophosphorylase